MTTSFFERWFNSFTDDTLRGVIETVYQQLQASGKLVLAAPAGAMYLVQGTITALQKV